MLSGIGLIGNMDKTEIKELYSEELTLIKRIQSYGKEHTHKNMERVERVTLLLLYRIYSNLYSSLLLTSAAYKKNDVSFFQLPIGIILRCAFTDCLFALYILNVDKERAIEELDLRRIEYAKSLLDRKEVFRDQVKSTGKELDDDFIDHIWELTMEDIFLGLLKLDENLDDLVLTNKTKDDLKKAGFLRTKSIEIKKLVEFLIGTSEIKELSTRLYHYFKYFSQYEHFSENGQGDVLVSSQENGNDNIHLPSAIKALSAGVEEIMKRTTKY